MSGCYVRCKHTEWNAKFLGVNDKNLMKELFTQVYRADTTLLYKNGTTERGRAILMEIDYYKNADLYNKDGYDYLPLFLRIGNTDKNAMSLFGDLSAVKVKSSSSKVIQSKNRLIHQSQLFLFLTERKHRVLPAQTVESSLHLFQKEAASSTFLLFQNFQVKKLSVCQAHTNTFWLSTKNVAPLDVDQINAANSALD